MSSNDQQESGFSPAYRLIHHYREHATAALDRYHSALVNDRMNEQIRLDLATAALNYYKVLHEFRDDDALDEEWYDRGIAWIEDAAGKQIVVEKSLPRANGATTTTTQPALASTPAEDLEQLILELNDVARELGFSAETTKSTTQTEISDEMMDKVKEWQQQNL